ncbi:MAG: hypothetical protein WDO24_04395 [Pseudomonadota bacterium]
MLLATLFASLLAISQAHAQFTYSDTSLSYKWGPSYKEPGVAMGHDIAKSIVSATHSDGYKYGENFINIDTLLSSNKDPAASSSASGNSNRWRDRDLRRLPSRSQPQRGHGQRDVQGRHRPRRPGSRQAAISAPKTPCLPPACARPMFGPSVAFDVPDGFFNLAFDLYKEWNNNGIVGKGVNFDTALRVEGAWGVGFHLLGQRIKYEGFFDVTTPKGKDGFGAQTVTEFLMHHKLKYDFGKLICRRSI